MLQEVTSFLQVNAAALTKDKALFQQSLAAFIRCNEDPSTSDNFKSKVPDLPGPLLMLLEHAMAKPDQDLVLLLLKVSPRFGLKYLMQGLNQYISASAAAEKH